MDTSADVSSSMTGDGSTLSHHGGYPNDGWGTISPYSDSPYEGSPLNEYPGFGPFVPPGLPPSETVDGTASVSEPSRRHRATHPAPLLPHGASIGHQQLPMLNTTWPSEITNPTPSSGAYSAPAVVAPRPRIMNVLEPPKLLSLPDKGRRTLSVEQKRAMCQYHDDNPGTRQADIGHMFGVDRSTVSKVLRHKDQHLRRDQETDAAALKRAGKSKNPDFDRTLSNYIKRQQAQGFDVNDDEIMEQAQRFARASGNQENILNIVSSGWLQKFKKRHSLVGGRLSRRASESNISDPPGQELSARELVDHDKDAQMSPVSSARPTSPLSGSRNDDEANQDAADFDFACGPSQSTRHSHRASVSGSNPSPFDSFTFSPEPPVSSFQVRPSLTVQSNDGTPPEPHHREKRSNTFPSIDADFGSPLQQPANVSESMKMHIPESLVDPRALGLGSPRLEALPSQLSTNAGVRSPPSLRRSGSSPSINSSRSFGTSPVTSGGLSGSSTETSPVSPSQEEVRHAASTLLNHLQSIGSGGQPFEPGEYQAFVQLAKKLQIHNNQAGRSSSIGGLSRIPEGDTEMTSTTVSSQHVMHAN